MRLHDHLLITLLAGLVFGCAHPIVITPDVSKLERNEVQPIACNVGFVITDVDRETVVTTPGGGGDKVRYFPYKELEPALFKVLSNVFQRAYPLKSPSDAASIKGNDIKFIFVPKISTDSSSGSAFTWPPTDFTIELKCTAVGTDGKVLWEKTFTGKGHAEFSEFKLDMPLAAKRATLQVMQEFQKGLNTAPALRPQP
jgi:hypothetical protein